MPTLTAGLSLNKETLEEHLSTMTEDQGREAYLAYGNVAETIQSIRFIGRVTGVSEKAIAHATRMVRRGAAAIGCIARSRALSG